MKKYTFFLGLKDKDSKMQIHPDSEYILKVQDRLATELWGGTITKWMGVFKHDDGTIVYENTLIIQTLWFNENESVYEAFAQNLRSEFNQESVLMEVSEVTAEFIS